MLWYVAIHPPFVERNKETRNKSHIYVIGGEPIEVSGRRHDATSIDLEVTGPLPKAWHVAVFTNGKRVEKSHESSDQVRVVLVENEDEYTLVVNVIATMWNDCLVVRSVRVK